eukprot:GHVT01100960.1.p1 GENE.GHVT01100960.1~~GHVT01100960.1.p1  ORF type:complete len:138 (-),score=33.39 GHVT01100960.1:89-502(-)
MAPKAATTSKKGGAAGRASAKERKKEKQKTKAARKSQRGEEKLKGKGRGKKDDDPEEDSDSEFENEEDDDDIDNILKQFEKQQALVDTVQIISSEQPSARAHSSFTLLNTYGCCSIRSCEREADKYLLSGTLAGKWP